MSSMIGSTGMNATGANTGGGMTGDTRMQKLGGYRHFQTQQFTPEQMQLFKQMFGNLGPDSFLSKLAGGDKATFDQLEAPALQQFQGLQGQIGSRFSGMGTGAQRSSGFKNTMNQASSDFAQQLQSNRIGLQQQAIKDLHGLSSDLMGQRPYNQFAVPKGRSFMEELLMGLIGAGGQAAGGYAQGKGAQAANLAAMAV